MMFIREALTNDLDGIADCAERFFEYAKYHEKDLFLDRESFKAFIKTHIEEDSGIVLLLMDGLYVAGGICGWVGEWGFNRSIKICNEVFYWIDEKYRGGVNSVRLLIEFENKAKKIGADRILMISVNTYLQDKVNCLYERKGYQKLEQLHIKTV